ncbi:MAG: phosphate ABC transporter substrate-binding protein [Clostridiales bacterium]|nr:phosphate ABC transporter substrate-binding protein [Clostridiales bacterium]
MTIRRIHSIHKVVFFFLAMLALNAGCSRTAADKGLTVAGSTSIQPFADHWAEVYMHEHPGYTVNVQGGGSSAGIQAAKSGAADIGMSSRELKDDEKDLLEIVVARDGLAVIVHPENPVDDLSLVQVQNIFAGNIRSWKYAGGPDREIHVVTREEGSGTRGAFQEMVMGKSRIFPRAIVQDSNGTVREIVANDPASIGYISLGLVNERVKAVRLNGVEPSHEHIEEKKYALVRPFLFVTSGPPKPAAQDFINFVLSREGQELVERDGLIPVFRN